jgi:hypothetical protein
VVTVIPPQMYSTIGAEANANAALYQAAAEQAQQFARISWGRSFEFAKLNSGAAADAGSEQLRHLAVAAQNQGRAFRESQRYNQRAARLADEHNDALNRIERQAQQELASAPVWDWPRVLSAARAQGELTSSEYTSRLGSTHMGAMSSIGPLVSAINGLVGGTVSAASSMPMTSGGVPAAVKPASFGQTKPMDMPVGGGDANPRPPTTTGPHPPAAPSAASSAAPAAAATSPQPQTGQPGQPQTGQPGQQDPAQPGYPRQPAPGDNPDDPDDQLGDEGSPQDMISTLLPAAMSGIMGVAMAVPQLFSKAGEQLLSLVSEGSQGLSSMLQGLGSSPNDDGELGEIPPISHGLPGIGNPAGVGASPGGVGGIPGSGAGAGGGHLGSPPTMSGATLPEPVARPIESAVGAVPPPTEPVTGGMPMMFPPMMGGAGMGGGGGGAMDVGRNTKTVKTPKPPNTELVDGEAGEPQVAVEVGDINGVPKIVQTFTRLVKPQ